MNDSLTISFRRSAAVKWAYREVNRDSPAAQFRRPPGRRSEYREAVDDSLANPFRQNAHRKTGYREAMDDSLATQFRRPSGRRSEYREAMDDNRAISLRQSANLFPLFGFCVLPFSVINQRFRKKSPAIAGLDTSLILHGYFLEENPMCRGGETPLPNTVYASSASLLANSRRFSCSCLCSIRSPAFCPPELSVRKSGKTGRRGAS